MELSTAMQRNTRRTTTQGVRSLLEEMMTSQMSPGGGPLAPRRAPAPPPSRSSQADDSAQPPEGLYIISVAARILSMHPQTLRKYERVGLVRPSRTMGMLRLYSEEDIVKLRMIKRLVDELRLNLAGVEMAMAVFDWLARARLEMGVRPSSNARAFGRMFDQIMDLFEGPPTPPGRGGPERDGNEGGLA